MKKIPQKNYYIVLVLIIFTVLITFLLVSLYNNKDKEFSTIYNYSNRITGNEFSEYFLESSDFIMYIADRNDLSNEVFEKKFKNKIDQLNLKNKLVYIDKSELNKKNLEELYNNYKIEIELDRLPVIISIIDRKATRIVYVNSKSNVDKVIKYEDFE